MKRVARAGFLVAVLLSTTPVWAGPAADFINAHPRVAYSIRWQYKVVFDDVGAYNVPESAKVVWADWSAAQKQQLEDAYQQALTWLRSPSPITDRGDESSLVYPPANLMGAGSQNDSGTPWTCVDADWSWNIYLRWIAQNLAIETEHGLPWSLLDYDTDMLKTLFDSTSIMAMNASGCYEVSAGSPGHPNYIKRSANLGDAMIAPPRYTYAFLAANGLIGATRQDTIVRLLGWVSANLVHFYGDSTYANYESIWQYRGAPPVSRIIEGTTAGSNGFAHWTAGCHGTSAFLRHVLRAANIPVQIVRTCGHSQVYFMSERLYMDHGDDPYNRDFQDSHKSPSELLISERTFNIWFHDSRPDNQDDDAICATALGLIGQMTRVVANLAERCDDGIDNDGDGLVDCVDTADCRSLTVPYRTKILATDFATEARFGTSADLNGHRAIIGAQTDPQIGYRAGAAYVFEYTPGTGWVQHAKLIASDALAHEFAGFAVSIDGDLAVSATETKDDFRGAAYLFARDGQGNWPQQAKLVASDGAQSDRFGVSTALRGGVLAIGATGVAGEAGAVYVFNRSGSAWTQNAKLTASDATGGAHLGYEIGLSGDTIAAGAFGSPAPGPAGAVYIFKKSGAGWAQEARLGPSIATDRDFGWAVSIDGDLLVVGAPTVAYGPVGTGAAYVFRRSGTSWTQEARLLASDGAQGDGFGSSVGVSGETVTVGAYFNNQATGAAYVFRRVNGQWTQQQKIVAWDASPDSWFGARVPISGDQVLVTAYGDDAAALLTGGAYFYGLGNTDIGQCMNVTAATADGTPSPVTIGFAGVAGPGSSTVTISAQGPAVPTGFQLGTPPTYYQVATTADYQGLIRVCVDYSNASYSSESNLTLLHYENSAWVDVCAAPSGCTRPSGSHVICGVVSSLSPFAVVQRSLLATTSVPAGYATTSTYFLSQELGSVGNLLSLDVFIPARQPDPKHLGQVQLTATVESQGIFAADLGTRQLTGLAIGAWNTLTFGVPASLQQTLLGTASAGHFTVVTNTPAGAQPLTLANLRFGGTLTPRPANAPARGSMASVLSFESASDWSATGGTLSSDNSQKTDGNASLRVVQNGTYTVVQSSDFLTRELTAVQDTVALDVKLSRRPAWGALQVQVDCPVGQSYWIGQADLTTMTAAAFNRVSMPLPSSVKSALTAGNQSCRVRVVISADAGEVRLDNLRL